MTLPPPPVWLVVYKYGRKRGSWFVEFWYLFTEADSEAECLVRLNHYINTTSDCPAWDKRFEFMGQDTIIHPAVQP